MDRFLRYALPPLLTAGAIVFMSAQPDPGGPDVPGLDKVAHAAAFGVLAWLTARALAGYGMPGRPAAVAAVLITVAFGVTDEWHQAYVPGRTPDLFDLVADAAGALAAMVLWLRAARR